MRLYLIALFIFLFPKTTYAVDKIYEDLFSDILKTAPDSLSLDYLRQLPKFRCIFHDGFDRLDTVPVDVKTRIPQKFFSLADSSRLGKNAWQSTDTYNYVELGGGGKAFKIGIKDYSIAYNRVEKANYNRIFKLIDTKRSDYGFLIARSGERYVDAKVAFSVVNTRNYYFVRLTDNEVNLYQVQGELKNVKFQRKIKDIRIVYVLLKENIAYLYADYKFIGKCRIANLYNSTLCGLLFTGNERSEIDDFVINYLDEAVDNQLDVEIEKGHLNKKNIRSVETEGDLLRVASRPTNKSNYSLRFQLDYYKDWENHKIGLSRRTEVVPRSQKSAPLDSWIISFDVYFPGIKDSTEYYVKDVLNELFWQQHAPSNSNMLSPNVALYLKNDVITFQTLSRSILRYDRIGVKSHRDYGENGDFGLLVDSITNSSQKIQVKRGMWHNVTIYIKEGYSFNHLPRSIMYFDGKKVVDWFIPNMQNCGEMASYMKIGIYKWPWAQPQRNLVVKQRVLYYDNFLYFR